MHGKIDNSRTRVGDLNATLSIMDRTSRQKIDMETDLNNTINQLDLTTIYKTLYPTTVKQTFFSRAHRQNVLQIQPQDAIKQASVDLKGLG